MRIRSFAQAIYRMVDYVGHGPSIAVSVAVALLFNALDSYLLNIVQF
jgi:hypothetical protein